MKKYRIELSDGYVSELFMSRTAAEAEAKNWDRVINIIEINDEQKKEYFTQNNGDCATCSLVNYGKDCHNIAI